MNALICYCFEYTSEDIKQDFIVNGRSLIMEKIKTEKMMGTCQCTIKNPSGKGCLPDVRRVVNEVKGNGTAYNLMQNDKSLEIIILDDSLQALKDRFNNHRQSPRFVALLSPTCPLGRDQGARAVHEIIITQFPGADIVASIVWIPILDKDSLEAALPTVKFLSDKRFKHYYDQDQMVGKEIANRIGWDGHVAWDIYLFYEPHAGWDKIPPKPTYWMHQLTDSWADKAHFRTGDGLVKELLNAMTKLLDIKNAGFLSLQSNTR